MSITEFDDTGWTPGMFARYTDGKVHPVASCDFEEKLVGLLGIVADEPDEVSWVRCENVTLENQ